MSSTMRWSGLSMMDSGLDVVKVRPVEVLGDVRLGHPRAPLQHEDALVVVAHHEHGNRARDDRDVRLQEAVELLRLLLRDGVVKVAAEEVEADADGGGAKRQADHAREQPARVRAGLRVRPERRRDLLEPPEDRAQVDLRAGGRDGGVFSSDDALEPSSSSPGDDDDDARTRTTRSSPPRRATARGNGGGDVRIVDDAATASRWRGRGAARRRSATRRRRRRPDASTTEARGARNDRGDDDDVDARATTRDAASDDDDDAAAIAAAIAVGVWKEPRTRATTTTTRKRAWAMRCARGRATSRSCPRVPAVVPTRAAAAVRRRAVHRRAPCRSPRRRRRRARRSRAAARARRRA